MPLQSPLFAYLHRQKAQDNKSQGFQYLEDKQGHPYYLQSLSNKPQSLSLTENNSIRIEEEHLSFYATYEKVCPWLSQYHYTGNIYNPKEQSRYKLHIYFNQDDQIVGILTAKDESGKTQEFEEKHKERIQEHATTQVFPLLRQLRQEVQAFREGQEEKYQQVELELSQLSEHLSDNAEAYQEKCDLALHHLDLLAPFDRGYAATAHLLAKMKEVKASPPLAVLEVAKLDSVPEDKLEPSSSTKKIKAKLKEKKDFASVMEKTEAARKAYLAKKAKAERKKGAVTLKERALPLVEMREHLTDLEILMEEKGLALVSLQQLARLQLFYKQEALIFLTMLIDKNEIETAVTLSPVAPYLPKALVKEAILKGNSSLLGFLLSYAAIPINSFLIDGLTLTQFCFKQKPTAAVVKCFTVLVQKKASLMVPMEDGLPLAHHILSTLSNPLRQAIYEGAELKAISNSLISNLGLAMNDYLTNHGGGLDGEVVEAIKGKMRVYSRNMFLTVFGAGPKTADAIRAMEAANQETQKKTSDKTNSYFQKLLEDKELNDIKTKYESLQKKYLALCPKQEKLGHLNHFAHFSVNEDNDVLEIEEDYPTFRANEIKLLQAKYTRLNCDYIYEKDYKKLSQHFIGSKKAMEEKNHAIAALQEEGTRAAQEARYLQYRHALRKKM